MELGPSIVEGATDDLRESARSLSRILFGGARYRLEIGAALTAGQLVNMSELADRLGISKQSVHQELRHLESAGLLGRIEQKERSVYFQAAPSMYWDFCRETFRGSPELLAHKGSP